MLINIADDPHPYLINRFHYNEFFVNSVDIHDNLSENSEYISVHSLKAGYNLVSFSVLPEDPTLLISIIPGTGSESRLQLGVRHPARAIPLRIHRALAAGHAD